MKNRLAILCLSAGILLTQCRVYNGSFNTWFCTNSGPGTTYYLYINDSSKGILPYLPQPPDCDNAGSRKAALFLHMRSGTFDVKVRDEQGRQYFACTISLWRSGDNISLSSSTEYKNVECRMRSKSDCLINEIYFH